MSDMHDADDVADEYANRRKNMAEPIVITGTVERIDRPTEWSTGQYGRSKLCVIHLSGADNGVNRLTYFWNEKNRAKELQADLFAGVQEGKVYRFMCNPKPYLDKKTGQPRVGYTPTSYLLAVLSDSPRHTEEKVEMDEPVPTPVTNVPLPVTSGYIQTVPIPTAIQAPKFKLVGFLIQDENGNVYEAKA